ncbi:hypothetical protein HDU96_004428 [Phlyctochytrium bullatum]|nr:hypothetical protein HDU96_004428 [Phlyctochytrium bullatum]
MRSTLIACVLVLLSGTSALAQITAAAPAAAPAPQLWSGRIWPIRTVVAFGDSLSDAGRARKLTTDKGLKPTAPSDAYPTGRFTNGPTWVEVFAKNRSLCLYNQAIGGATTSDKVVQGFLGNLTAGPQFYVNVSSVNAQIAEYTSSFTNRILLSLPTTLVTIWVGANDKLNNDRLKIGKTGDFFAKAAYDNWAALAKAGTKNILTLVSPRLSAFDNAYNDETFAQAARFRTDFPKTRLEVLDMTPTILSVLQNVTAAGFEFGVNRVCCPLCNTGLPPLGKATVCSNPEKYVLWDEIHPSAKIHERFAATVEDLVGSVWGC